MTTIKKLDSYDSSVLWNMAKIADDKGMIKPSISKIASTITKEAKLGEDVIENIMILSSQLRKNGFDKYAEVLENKVMNYKRAEHLYKAHNEEGEDVLNFAHPEGSVKVNDAQDGNGEVEDLLDVQKKMLEIAKKNPKISKANLEIVNQCMIALGEDPNAWKIEHHEVGDVSHEDDINTKIKNIINLALNGMQKAKDIVRNSYNLIKEQSIEINSTRIKKSLEYTEKIIYSNMIAARSLNVDNFRNIFTLNSNCLDQISNTSKYISPLSENNLDRDIIIQLDKALDTIRNTNVTIKSLINNYSNKSETLKSEYKAGLNAIEVQHPEVKALKEEYYDLSKKIMLMENGVDTQNKLDELEKKLKTIKNPSAEYTKYYNEYQTCKMNIKWSDDNLVNFKKRVEEIKKSLSEFGVKI